MQRAIMIAACSGLIHQVWAASMGGKSSPSASMEHHCALANKERSKTYLLKQHQLCRLKGRQCVKEQKKLQSHKSSSSRKRLLDTFTWSQNRFFVSCKFWRLLLINHSVTRCYNSFDPAGYYHILKWHNNQYELSLLNAYANNLCFYKATVLQSSVSDNTLWFWCLHNYQAG